MCDEGMAFAEDTRLDKLHYVNETRSEDMHPRHGGPPNLALSLCRKTS